MLTMLTIVLRGPMEMSSASCEIVSQQSKVFSLRYRDCKGRDRDPGQDQVLAPIGNSPITTMVIALTIGMTSIEYARMREDGRGLRVIMSLRMSLEGLALPGMSQIARLTCIRVTCNIATMTPHGAGMILEANLHEDASQTRPHPDVSQRSSTTQKGRQIYKGRRMRAMVPWSSIAVGGASGWARPLVRNG